MLTLFLSFSAKVFFFVITLEIVFGNSVHAKIGFKLPV